MLVTTASLSPPAFTAAGMYANAVSEVASADVVNELDRTACNINRLDKSTTLISITV